MGRFFLPIAALSLLATTILKAEPFYGAVHPPVHTPWDTQVTPDKVLPEYPRPQLVRNDWQNLNGTWNFSLAAKDAPPPVAFADKILVPFPVESWLSGIKKMMGPDQRMWYRREFTIPEAWSGKRILLHFGAVSYEAAVFVNGKPVGTHQGDYDGFSFDITDAIKPGAPQELVVSAWNPVQTGMEPLGKQSTGSYSIYHTASSGIWQTVWLEPVPAASIASLKFAPDIDKGVLNLVVTGAGTAAGDKVEAVALDGSQEVGRIAGEVGAPLALPVPNAKLWSPAQPFLYDLKVTLTHGGQPGDAVASYFGMRKISMAKDARGIPRLMLNNKPSFALGVLDQGFWPDGVYTAPTDDALRYDVEMLRKYGFNTDRKHVKVEPDRWYYWCDKLGVLVWQDMPSMASNESSSDVRITDAAAAEFEKELKAMIDGRGNHPCIVTWIVFNESWGQYDTARLTDWVRQYDPSRLVDSASGFTDFHAGDFHDRHDYGRPPTAPDQDDRISVIGEFGAVAADAHGDAFTNLMKPMAPLVGTSHLNGTIYTQLSDQEQERGGALLSDERKPQVDPAVIAAGNKLIEDAAATDEAATSSSAPAPAH
jgi:beta-galactosidase/beta-glucuronidase